MSKLKFYETPEFRKLQKLWYDKLSAAGFTDSTATTNLKSLNSLATPFLKQNSLITSQNPVKAAQSAQFYEDLLAILNFAESNYPRTNMRDYFSLRGASDAHTTISHKDIFMIKLSLVGFPLRQIAVLLNTMFESSYDFNPTSDYKAFKFYHRRLNRLASFGRSVRAMQNSQDSEDSHD